jgi:hypothetical protein
LQLLKTFSEDKVRSIHETRFCVLRVKALGLREALAFLVEREIARKDERRITMACKIAHFPAVRDLDGFDFAAQPSLDPRQVRELAACRWVAHGEALLLLGPPGVGKTHLAIALGRAAIREGYSSSRLARSARCSACPICFPSLPAAAVVLPDPLAVGPHSAGYRLTEARTESLQTLRWRKEDSNRWSHECR